MTLALLPCKELFCPDAIIFYLSLCHIILSLRLKRQKEKARKKQLKKQGGQKKESSGSENTSDEDDDAGEAGSTAEKRMGKKTEEQEPSKETKPEPIVVSCTVEI